MELNERIIQARKQAGLTQEQLGEKLGVSRQAVSKWESGQANPDVAYITEMCKLFEVSADWLLLGAESGSTTAEHTCPQCCASVKGQDRFCPQCGSALGERQLMGRCPDCGTTLSADAAYCTKCGKQLEGGETYCLYLTQTSQYGASYVADRLYQLLLHSWVVPAFPCDETITLDVAKHLVVNAAPLELCHGLTYEQALKGAKYFEDYPGVLKVYRDSDMITESSGVVRPNAPSLSITPASESSSGEKEPLSGLAIFGLVVLGVIVAILIMSVF